MSGSLFIAEQKMAQFFRLFCPGKPVFDNARHTTLQDRGHPLFFHAGRGLTSKHLLAKKVGELSDFEGLTIISSASKRIAEMAPWMSGYPLTNKVRALGWE